MATSTTAASTTTHDAEWFRKHDVFHAFASPLLRQLCENWASLNASAEACLTVAEWAATHECLAGLATPGQILDHIAVSAPAVKDQVLRVLLGLARNGDRLAGQVLLHTMLPVLAAMPKTIRSPYGYEENLRRVLGEFWEVVLAERQLTRPGVAGRLRMDTLHRVTSSHRRWTYDVWGNHVQVFAPEDFAQFDNSPAWHRETSPTMGDSSLSQGRDPAQRYELNPNGDLASLLLWMRDNGDFTNDEARFFGEVYLASGGDQKAAAERLGLSHAATRQRVTRLRNRLCAAVKAEINGAAADLDIAS